MKRASKPENPAVERLALATGHQFVGTLTKVDQLSLAIDILRRLRSQKEAVDNIPLDQCLSTAIHEAGRACGIYRSLGE